MTFYFVEGPNTGPEMYSDEIAGVHYGSHKLMLGAAGTAVHAVGGAGNVSSAVLRACLADDDKIHTKLTGFAATATFTPANSSHAAGTTYGASGGSSVLQFSNMGNASGITLLNRAFVMLNNTTALGTGFQLHLYSSSPGSAYNDIGSWDIPSGDQSAYQDVIDIPQMTDWGSTQRIIVPLNLEVEVSSSGHLFGYLVGLTTATPPATSGFTVGLRGIAVK